MVHSPFILESLETSTTYEVRVEAVNQHGAGPPTARLVFRTPNPAVSRQHDFAQDVSRDPSNDTVECCRLAGLTQACLPLCARAPDPSLARQPGCRPALGSVLRCAVAGRDHGVCCARRGVAPKKSISVIN